VHQGILPAKNGLHQKFLPKCPKFLALQKIEMNQKKIQGGPAFLTGTTLRETFLKNKCIKSSNPCVQNPTTLCIKESCLSEKMGLGAQTYLKALEFKRASIAMGQGRRYTALFWIGPQMMTVGFGRRYLTQQVH